MPLRTVKLPPQVRKAVSAPNPEPDNLAPELEAIPTGNVCEIGAEQRILNPADRVASSSLGWICGEEAPSIFQDDFRFLFQSCKIRIGLKGYECRMVP